MSECLKCKSQNVVQGAVAGVESYTAAVFRPQGLRGLVFPSDGGVLLTKEAYACLDCGLTWSSTPPDKLAAFVQRHCNARSKSIESGTEAEFAGVYVLHWEVARFVIEVGRRFWGLLPRHERWVAHFPSGYKLPGEGELGDLRHAPGRYFRMRFIGTPGALGRFGHKGICCREVEIRQVLEAIEVKNPGSTW